MLLKPRVSACIVLYHSGNQALQAIRSAEESTLPIDLHLADNSPEELSSRMIHLNKPDIDYLAMPKNLGYGAANNAVMGRISSEYHIIMNPDVTFEPTLVERMVRFMDEHKDVAILTPRVFGPDGQEQLVPRRQPTVRYMLSRSLEGRFRFARAWRNAYTLADAPLDTPMSVQFATGCFMLVRTNVLQRLHGFDERFFLYHEDSDLSRRALEYGKIVYHPDFAVTHIWAR